METVDLVQQAFDRGMIQVPQEICALVNLLRRANALPLRNVMEIGSEAGGTFFLWCRLAILGGKKISLDLPGGASGSGNYVDPAALAARTARFKSWAPRVHVVTGDSHDREIRYQVLRILDREPLDFLFIDGDHSAEGVKADYRDYGGLVRRGGLIAFHDIRESEHHKMRGCFVHEFWQELEGEKWDLIEPSSHWGGIGVLAV
jgi:cephalosporin hydroxylase